MDDIVFIGDWIKDRILGSGSFGTVVLWRHKSNEDKLAIKTCKWSDELTPKHRERWTKEVEMLQTCSHPNIVGTKILPQEFMTGLARANPSKLPILCMEYCSGGDLRQHLNRANSCCGLKEIQIRKILRDIGSAMRFLHSNKITHRDLKPENIVVHIKPENNTTTEQNLPLLNETFKIIDLGYAKEIDSNSICASFVGTLQYLAPELFYSKSYSNSVDFWSFGLLSFEIICGVRPFLPFKAPVEWMPLVKKKSHDNICVYESFHGDINYSDEIYPENHISKPFKACLEQWLKLALEWDPKLRGRDSPSKVTFDIPSEVRSANNSGNVIMFSLLEQILEKKIITIFSVSTLSRVAYEINDTTTIKDLKCWIYEETKIATEDQIIISQITYSYLSDDEIVANYWDENMAIMLYTYNKKKMVDDAAIPIVPKAVQRVLEHPKTLFNYRNSQNLYRNAFYFVISQMELYEALINGIVFRAESLKQVSKQLLLKYNNVDKDIGKLLARVEVLINMTNLGKNHIGSITENAMSANILDSFGTIFKDTDNLLEETQKLHQAWSQMSVRLQSAARRSNEDISSKVKAFLGKFNYQNIFIEAHKAFVSHTKSDFFNGNREKERHCMDMMKICYNCLKLRCSIVQELPNQPFILKFKDFNTEFDKISDIISHATEHIQRLESELSSLIGKFSEIIWSTISGEVREIDASELPYSVVSFQKRDFKVGEAVSNHCIPVKTLKDDTIKLLISESLKLRQNHTSLCEKLKSQKELLQQTVCDFSFLKNES